MPTSLDPTQFMSPTIIGGAASLLAKAGTPDAYPAFGMTMRFKVTVPALGSELGHWSSCKGLKVTFNTTPVKEGGDYATSTFLPERVEYTKVTLERAMTKGDSAKVVDWLRKVQSNWITPTRTPLELDNVWITLFDAGGEEAVMSWTLSKACPVSWTCSPFASDKGALAVETLELQHQGFL
jgi:phage tail-like protein